MGRQPHLPGESRTPRTGCKRLPERFHPAREKLPEKPGHGCGNPLEPLRHRIGVVARKQLVTCIARKRNRHLPARQLRDEIGRNLGRIRKGFVVKFRQSRHELERRLRRYIELRMLGPEMLRNLACIDRLVEPGHIKPDCKAAHRPCRPLLHQCHHGGAINSTRQKRPDRYVSHHLLANGIAEQGFKCVNSLVRRSRKPVFYP